jgi:dUTP pyrophosphatase
VDSDYRGEIKVALVNHGKQPFVVERGARIAQLVIGAVVRATLHEVAELPDTVRGVGGFGHTGA